MTDENRKAKFESKVAELLAVTSGLSVTHIFMLRRMTQADPETSSWANERELGVVFDTILDRAVAAMDVEVLGAAADQQFDTLLPPGDEDQRDKERWQLFDITKKYLGKRKKVEVVVEVPPPVTEEEVEEPIDHSSFKSMFDETIARYTRRSLLCLVVGPNHGSLRPFIPVPFIAAPGFAACYETLLRKFVLPDLRATKRILALQQSRTWDETGSNRLIGMIQSGGAGNPILDTWDSRWAAYGSEGIGTKHKKGENPWEVFTEAAKAGNYTPPNISDIPLLHSVIRWEPESMLDAWRELTLLYQQEFHPKSRHDQAREGAVRDCIVRRIRELPKRAGDMLAIKAFFELPKCDRMFLRKLMHSVGGTDTERNRVAPGLVHFYNNLPP
ncbi:hypothetical protein A6A04_07940 [Paramagnetospirillum marisnigri]|uniref:Uncharacterized protein n=1 Tax=Paramagnetospirillum marisnigri TaxID=1285242 RepID=A0A178M7M8_9PROT|nr:hypothetical protein [Paramagnetospirillum marisnigri]OAN44742.1 hypothetical protein A6A04_07940 [Paramagnetospirillum marisnigri]